VEANKSDKVDNSSQAPQSVNTITSTSRLSYEHNRLGRSCNWMLQTEQGHQRTCHPPARLLLCTKSDLHRFRHNGASL